MDCTNDIGQLISSVVSGVAAIITACATIFLYKVTKILAVETKKMADASKPHIVATLVINKWSMKHMDLHIDNTGNATAYDIEISFNPPLKNTGVREKLETLPFQKISVLNPNQGLSTYLSEYSDIKDKSYFVEISWKNNSMATEREYNRYILNIGHYEGVTKLGDDNPLCSIANKVEKISDDIRKITNKLK